MNCTTETVAYFVSFYDARDFGAAVGYGYPAWLVVPRGDGYAIQCRPGGDYFTHDGGLTR